MKVLLNIGVITDAGALKTAEAVLKVTTGGLTVQAGPGIPLTDTFLAIHKE